MFTGQIPALRFAELFSKKDAQGIGELLDDSFALFDPVLKWVRGKTAVIALFQKQFEETNWVNYQVLNAYQDGNTSILEFRLVMDQKIYEGVDFIVWKDGKMIELRCYFNPQST